LVDVAKALGMGSVIAQIALKVPDYAKDGIASMKGEKKAEAKKDQKPKASEETKEGAEGDEKTTDEAEKENVKDSNGDGEFIVENDASATFKKVADRFHWSSPLGLSKSSEDAINGWKSMKEAFSERLDFGPKNKKKGPQAQARIICNLCTHAVEYVSILLALMMLRAFLFRSYFACLPWLALYQFLSVFVPLAGLEKLPQVPVEKVPPQLRIAATTVLNALLLLFFVYELVWKTYFFEKIPLIGLVVYHAYAIRPVEK